VDVWELLAAVIPVGRETVQIAHIICRVVKALLVEVCQKSCCTQNCTAPVVILKETNGHFLESTCYHSQIPNVGPVTTAADSLLSQVATP